MLRILIADDHAMFRHGLRALLEREPDLEIVGEAADGHETLRLLDAEPVDVLVLDLSMPGGLSGARIAEEALAANRRLAIVVLTMHEDEYYLRELLELGVRAYVLKKSRPEALLGAVRAAARGEQYVDPALVGHLVHTFVGGSGPAPTGTSRSDALTPREKEVLSLLALGHTNAEVGRKLHISKRTVETHRQRIMSRLDLRNRAELVRFALDHGLMKVD